MDVETFSTGPGMYFNIEIAPAPADGKRYPVVVLVHGNLGLAKPFGDQLRDFTQEIATLGYLAALPSFYRDGQSHMDDSNIAAHVPTVTAAIKHLSGRSDADPDRLGLVGFSLGGGIAMSYITASPAGTVKVFADFYGYVEPLLRASNFTRGTPPVVDGKPLSFADGTGGKPFDSSQTPIGRANLMRIGTLLHVVSEW